MDDPNKTAEDTRVDQAMGNLLRTGVILAAVVTAVGGAFYLAERSGQTIPPYKPFPLEEKYHPSDLNSVSGIVRLAFTEAPGKGIGRGLIQLGVLLLIATPVVRVAFSVYVFACERDRLYVVVTLAVLALLLFSLFSGGWLPGG